MSPWSDRRLQGDEFEAVDVADGSGAGSFFWSEDEINERLVRIMKAAFRGVWDTATQHGVTLRTAAYIVACTRILNARDLRGLYP